MYIYVCIYIYTHALIKYYIATPNINMKSTQTPRKYLSYNVKLYSTITPGQEPQK